MRVFLQTSEQGIADLVKKMLREVNEGETPIFVDHRLKTVDDVKHIGKSVERLITDGNYDLVVFDPHDASFEKNETTADRMTRFYIRAVLSGAKAKDIPAVAVGKWSYENADKFYRLGLINAIKDEISTFHESGTPDELKKYFNLSRGTTYYSAEIRGLKKVLESVSKEPCMS